MASIDVYGESNALRVIDQTVAFTTGVDASHGNFQSLNGVPTFVAPGGTVMTLESSTSPLTTKGDILTFDTAPTRLGIGANNTVLVADSAQATGNKWSATLAGLTLTQPTIADFTNATHTHQSNAQGGSLDAAAIGSGTLNNARVNWASPSAIGTGTPAAGTFTTLTATTGTFTDLVTITKTTQQLSLNYDGSNKAAFTVSSSGNLTVAPTGGALALTSTLIATPIADGTAVFGIKNNAATNYGIVYDSTNQRVGINPLIADTVAKGFHIFYKDVRFEQITAPGACTGALAGAGAGNVDNGAHIYKVTFVSVTGETELGTSSNTVTVTDKTTNGQVSLTAIPTASAGLQVSARKIYRTKAAGSTYFLLTTISDNTTTTYTDNTADASLDADDATSRNNTTGGGFWIGALRGGFLGSSAGANVSFGVNTLGNSTTANNNAAFGVNALNLVTTAAFNTAIGSGSFSALVSGTHNVGVGYASALVATGSNTTAVGSQALRSLSTGASNTAIGTGAGYLANGTTANATTTGTLNTFLGRQTGYANSTQWSRVIAIGNNAVAGANSICVIGGTGSDAVDLALERTTASARLHVTKVDTGTNTVLNVEIMNHNSSGSIAANFGIGSLWTGQDSTSPDIEFGRLRYYWGVATHASRQAIGRWSVYDTAERDAVQILADGTGAIFETLAGIRGAVRVVTAAGAVTVTNQDYIVVVNKGTGAATTVNLPAGVTNQIFIIKDGKGDANTNNITITPAAGNIDGAGTLVINTNYGKATIVYNGTQWNQLA